MNNRKAKQMIEETQGVLFVYEQKVKKGHCPKPCVILKNNNRAVGVLIDYGYWFN